MPRLPLPTRTALSLLLFWACTQPASVETGGLVTTDSAGVRIFAADSAGAERWRVAPEPTWVVGRQDAGGPVLHEVTDARRLPGEMVAIANGSSREILVVDPRVGRSSETRGRG